MTSFDGFDLAIIDNQAILWCSLAYLRCWLNVPKKKKKKNNNRYNTNDKFELCYTWPSECLNKRGLTRPFFFLFFFLNKERDSIFLERKTRRLPVILAKGGSSPKKVHYPLLIRTK
ncbi:hypothetical protein PUN28_013068 [Cardiocondyla obscurior]|uniref:Uncharacterized protein n=1 Tax=Cardiocondyla obscurior TaxID=286306 RepID=A0AAW2F9A3_9HYME